MCSRQKNDEHFNLILTGQSWTDYHVAWNFLKNVYFVDNVAIFYVCGNKLWQKSTELSTGNQFCSFLFKQRDIDKEGNIIFSTFITFVGKTTAYTSCTFQSMTSRLYSIYTGVNFCWTGVFFCWNLFVDQVPSAKSTKNKLHKIEVLYTVIISSGQANKLQNLKLLLLAV